MKSIRMSDREEAGTTFDPGIESLLKAIVLRSVLDYEQLLSDTIPEKGSCCLEEIERYWQEDVQVLTDIDMMGLKDTIDCAHEELCHIAWSDGEEIIAETMQLRKKHQPIYQGADHQLTHRCPLCRGGLYARRIPKAQPSRFRIHCTGCRLAAVVPA